MGIHWIASEQAYLLIFLLIPILLLVYRAFHAKVIYRALGAQVEGMVFLKHASWIRFCVTSGAFFIGLLFLMISLLRPAWNKHEEKIVSEGRDLFIALDISKSMLAQDCLPNRLECAKKKIKLLVNELRSDRVGLLLFAGSSMVSCPLTSDIKAFSLFLDQIDSTSIASGSTAIDKAIMHVMNIFKKMGDKKNKLLVIFTDGEDFSPNLSQVKKEAADQGLALFTVGIGTIQGAPIPLYDHYANQIGHQKNQNGEVVISQLGEQTLSQLAQDVGGTYIKSTDDNQDIKIIAKSVRKFDKERSEERKIMRYEDQFRYFLMVSFICFLIEWLL